MPCLMSGRFNRARLLQPPDQPPLSYQCRPQHAILPTCPFKMTAISAPPPPPPPLATQPCKTEMFPYSSSTSNCLRIAWLNIWRQITVRHDLLPYSPPTHTHPQHLPRRVCAARACMCTAWDKLIRGCTCGGVHVPYICTYARWELP